MKRKFKCIKGFSLSKYDENESLIEGEEYVVPLNSVWEAQEYAHVSEVRLVNDDLGWLEIDGITLETYFLKI